MSEDHRTEYKRTLNDKLEREVVGFLNVMHGGDIFIGIDEDGTRYGIKNPDKTMLTIKDRITNNISPSCLGLFEVYKEVAEGKPIIRILVAGGSEKPYHLKKYGMSPKGCFIRKGTATEPMTQEMINSLFSSRTRNSLRNIVSSRQNLSFKQLKIYYEGNPFVDNEYFEDNLEMFTETNKYNYIAFLLADKNSSAIRFGKYSGTTKNEMIERIDFGYESLIKATYGVLDKLKVRIAYIPK